MYKVALPLILLFVCVAGTSHAELLQRFHVLGFRITSDTPRPQVGVPFHVTLTVHVRERVTQLQYVSLPTFSGLESLGSQQHLTQGAGGSVYTETLTLVAHRPGPVAIGSSYLDAVDLHDGKTKRFISNNLILSVIGAAPARVTFRTSLLIILGLLLLAAAIVAIQRMLRRRRHRPTDSEPEESPIETPMPAPEIDFCEALANLRTRRDRSSVLHVREALRSIAGATQTETLGDLLQHVPANGENLRPILIAIEQAAFVHDTRLQQSIDDALSADEQRVTQ